MYGYLRGEIEWVKDGQQVQSGGRYSITVSAGSREGQDGGESSVSSVVSQLTIHSRWSREMREHIHLHSRVSFPSLHHSDNTAQ